MNERPLIFLTNDDGIDSPGLLALANSISQFAEIEIIAPSDQMTASGRGLFGDRSKPLIPKDLIINGENFTAYHTPGSPAQVVMLGMQVIGAKRFPDLLISGINYGENVGQDISMSGTIGAAIQARCMGVPALAVSLQVPVEYHYQYGEVNWDVAGHFSAKFAQKMLGITLPKDVDLLKVDIPQDATRDTEWTVTKVANRGNFMALLDSPNLNSTLKECKIVVRDDFETVEKDSDIYTLHIKKLVSVSPISLDVTSRIELPKLQNFINDSD